VNERVRNVWHKIDGPIGAILVATVVGWTGYVVRGYEDGGIVATLIERIGHARLDERAQQQAANAAVVKGYQDRAIYRDQQVATLIDQNKTLIKLLIQSSAARSAQLKVLSSQIDKAAEAATAANDAARVASVKAAETSKKLDTATNPTAVVPPTPWIGNRKP
jgi:hypothetical protein